MAPGRQYGSYAGGFNTQSPGNKNIQKREEVVGVYFRKGGKDCDALIKNCEDVQECMVDIIQDLQDQIDDIISGGGIVNSVSNVDGTLTIAPTTGNVIASLNLANANIWGGKQTFNTVAPRVGTATASTAAVFDANKDLISSVTTLAELAFVSGVTSSIQTQLNNKQPLDATLTALAAYNTNGILTQTAPDTFTGRTITGTAARIAVTNGNGVSGNPTIDIDATYVGQTSITTLGSITTGTWNGTTIAVNRGGTGLTSVALGSILAANTANVLTAVTSTVGTTVLTNTAGVISWAAAGGGGSSAISALTIATATNTIDNTNYKQEWQWSTLAGTDALKISSTSTLATGNTQTLLNVDLSGANANSAQTTYAAQFSNTHTGTTSTNVAIFATASGGTTANICVDALHVAGGIAARFRTSTSGIQFQQYTALTNYYAIYPTGVTPGTTNMIAFIKNDGTDVGFNAATGGQFTISAGGAGNINFNASANGITIGANSASSRKLTVTNTTLSNTDTMLVNASGTAAAGNAKTALNVQTSGANATSTQTTYGIQSSNVSTGTSSTNIAGYFTASGGTNNYALIVPSGGGNVGIGTITPAVTDAIAIVGTNSGRISITVQNTNSAGNASFYFQNDRGSFASYGGLLHSGSTNAATFFGVSAVDKTFLISDGASSLGLGVGTLVSQPLTLGTNNLARVTILGAGNIGIGLTVPTAYMHFKAGTATAGTAPIKLTTASAVLNTTAEAGAIETNGTHLFWTDSAANRYQLDQQFVLVKDIAQTAHGFTVGQLLKRTTTSYQLAQADSAANAEVVGMVTRVVDANNFVMTTYGYFTGLTGLTANTTYFLSPTVAGGYTTTNPVAGGQVSKPLFNTDSTTSGYFINMRGSVNGGAAGTVRVVGIQVVDAATNTATGDAKAFFRIPSTMNNWVITGVAATVYTAGTTGTTDIQIRNKTTGNDVLSTKMTIDSTETDTNTAATPAVINTANDDVTTGQVIAIDVDAISTTPAQGLFIEIQFTSP